MSAGIAALVAQLAELTAVLRPVAERIAAETSPAGRDLGSSRHSDPGEAVPPATATPGQPGDQLVDERAERIAGLRELIDWMEANPEVPLPHAGFADYPENRLGGDKVASLAELRRLGAAIGAEPWSPYGAHVYLSSPQFRGGVHWDSIVCDAAELLRAEKTAAGATADTAPADGAPVRGGTPTADPAPVEPGDGAAAPTDIAPAGGEVAGPDDEAGSATAPEPQRPIVLVASPVPGGKPSRAELWEDKGGSTVKVVYCDSRTGARVARHRILGPAESEG